MAYLTIEQLCSLGLKSFGENVLISEKASIYGASRISVGNNVRIDDFCVLSAGDGGIEIGSFVHIAVYSSLIGREGIVLDNYCNISSRVSIYSSSDDFSGATLTNPTIPDEFKALRHDKVHLHEHVIVGSGAIIMPGVTVRKGGAIGALSFVICSVPEFSIVAGIPAQHIKYRKQDLLEVERNFLFALQDRSL